MKIFFAADEFLAISTVTTIRKFGLGIIVALSFAASQAVAADLPLKAPPAPTPVENWSGFYLGVHAGWGWTTNDPATANTLLNLPGFPVGPFQAPASFDLSSNGPIFGGQIGYNKQFGAWVFGIEGDVTRSRLKGTGSATAVMLPPFGNILVPTVSPGPPTTMEKDANWLATIRGRIGHIWGPALIYFTGGVAFANVDYKANLTDFLGFACNNTFPFTGCTFPAAFSKTKTGWTIGGGSEVMLTQNWTVRAEYLFYKFDGESTSVGAVGTPALAGLPLCQSAPIPTTCSTTYSWGGLNIHTVRMGLNYKF
jgi:outer membrane immunogenic protein